MEWRVDDTKVVAVLYSRKTMVKRVEARDGKNNEILLVWLTLKKGRKKTCSFPCQYFEVK